MIRYTLPRQVVARDHAARGQDIRSLLPSAGVGAGGGAGGGAGEAASEQAPDTAGHPSGAGGATIGRVLAECSNNVGSPAATKRNKKTQADIRSYFAA